MTPADGESEARPSGVARRISDMPETTVYVGTFTRFGRSRGIHVFDLDRESGALKSGEVVSGITDPAYVFVSERHRRLYVACHVNLFGVSPGGRLLCFPIESTSGLPGPFEETRVPFAGPVFMSVDEGGTVLLVASLPGAGISVFRLDAQGDPLPDPFAFSHVPLGEAANRVPMPHGVVVDPGNRFAVVTDMGLDCTYSHRMNVEEGRLEMVSSVLSEIGSGPRHPVFHRRGDVLYVVNQHSSTVTVLLFDAASGSMSPLQTVSTLPAGFGGENAAGAIHLDPSNRFVIVSNRGHDSLAVFQIEENTGRLRPARHTPSGGRHPRDFAFSPDGLLLVANMESDLVVAFTFNAETGEARLAGGVTGVPSPSSICFFQRRPAPLLDQNIRYLR